MAFTRAGSFLRFLLSVRRPPPSSRWETIAPTKICSLPFRPRPSPSKSAPVPPTLAFVSTASPPLAPCCNRWSKPRCPDSPAPRTSGAVRDRALGAFRLLRDALPPHSVSHRYHYWRDGVEPGARQPCVRLVQRPGLSHSRGGRVDRRSISGQQPVIDPGERSHLRGALQPGIGPGVDLLRRAHAHRAGDRFLQA